MKRAAAGQRSANVRNFYSERRYPNTAMRWTPPDRQRLSQCEQNPRAGVWCNRQSVITGTTVAKASGLDVFNGKSGAHKFWAEKLGILERSPVDKLAQTRMDRGSKFEDRARAIYCAITKNSVEERGIVISHTYPWLGHSPDGYVVTPNGEDVGLIEIKVPVKAYTEISTNHMVQMQIGMYIHGKPWCDYVVYTTEDALPLLRSVASEVNPRALKSIPPPMKNHHYIKIIRIERNDDYITSLLMSMEYFMDCFENHVCPQDDMFPAADDMPTPTTRIIHDDHINLGELGL